MQPRFACRFPIRSLLGSLSWVYHAICSLDVSARTSVDVAPMSRFRFDSLGVIIVVEDVSLESYMCQLLDDVRSASS